MDIKLPARSQNYSTFGERLRALISENSENQEDFAKRLNISQSKLSKMLSNKNAPQWVEELEIFLSILGPAVSLWLMGYALNDRDGIQWIENFPSRLPPSTRKDDLLRGANLFRSLVKDKAEITHILDQLGYSTFLASDILRVAFEECSVLITGVAENLQMSEAIYQKFSAYNPTLKKSTIIVAEIPTELKVHTIRSELIAFLAAKKIFGMLEQPHAVAFGSGYTLMRLADQARFSSKPFYGTRWIPLMAFPNSLYNEPGATNYSANDIVSIMLRYHAKTKRYLIPYPDHSANREIATSVLNQAFSEADTFLISANGLDKNRRIFCASDYCTEIRYLSNLYNGLDVNKRKKFAGELLGWMINTDGSLTIPEDTIRNFVYSPELEMLKKAVTLRKRVWLIASRPHKQRIALAALKNCLVNALVIDKDIADYLLRNADVDLNNDYEALSDSQIYR